MSNSLPPNTTLPTNVGCFNEHAMSVWEYTRCQRPDGSTYGTSGQCRKGVETGAEEKPGFLSRAKRLAKKAVRKVTGAEKRERKAAETRAKEEKESARKAEVARRTANTEEMVSRVKKDVPADTTVKNVEGNLTLSKTTRSGHKIDYIVTRTGNVEFSVNGTWDAGTVKDRREQVEVALNVKKMHEAVVKNLQPGHRLWTSAWAEDGRGEARIKAYQAMGFSPAQGEENTMVARRTESGKLEPVGGKIRSSSLFEEQDFSENAKEVRLWYIAIFGKDVTEG